MTTLLIKTINLRRSLSSSASSWIIFRDFQSTWKSAFTWERKKRKNNHTHTHTHAGTSNPSYQIIPLKNTQRHSHFNTAVKQQGPQQTTALCMSCPTAIKQGGDRVLCILMVALLFKRGIAVRVRGSLAMRKQEGGKGGGRRGRREEKEKGNNEGMRDEREEGKSRRERTEGREGGIKERQRNWMWTKGKEVLDEKNK